MAHFASVMMETNMMECSRPSIARLLGTKGILAATEEKREDLVQGTYFEEDIAYAV